MLISGTKKEPKPEFFSLDISWWGGGLPREGTGAKKFGMSLETQGIKLFCWDIPGFCRDIPEAPEKFEKKKVWVQFLAPIILWFSWFLEVLKCKVGHIWMASTHGRANISRHSLAKTAW